MPSWQDNFTHKKMVQAHINPYDREVSELMWSNGLYNRRDMGMYTAFSRIPSIDVDNALTNAREYVFFTKPDLHLINLNTGGVASMLEASSFFQDVVSRYTDVCYQLQSSASRSDLNKNRNGESPFINILSNNIRSELSVPDSESDTDVETGANDYGTKIIYRGTSYTSDQEHNFSIEFEDTKYLETFMLFKIYDEYEKYKNLGLLQLRSPGDSDYTNDDDRWIRYTLNKIIHDQFSIYKFIVGEDGETIIYYCMYTGVFPTGAPRDSFSRIENSQTGQAITVNFRANFFRDSDPVIIGSFNHLVESAYSKSRLDRMSYLPIFNSNIHRFDGRWATTPIVRVNVGNGGKVGRMMQYKLNWLL